MLKFKLCLLSQGTTHCEGVFSELPGNALSQVQEPDLSAVRKAAAFNVSTQPWTHEQRSSFTCSCVNCRMIAFFFQSRVKCMKTSGKMFHMPLSHLWCLCSELHSEGASKKCLNNNTRCQNTPNTKSSWQAEQWPPALFLTWHYKGRYQDSAKRFSLDLAKCSNKIFSHI